VALYNHCRSPGEDVLDLIRPDDPRQDAGFDTGLTALLTDSEGNKYDPPKAWDDNRARLRSAQKKMSRQFEARGKQYEVLVAQAKAEGRPVSPLKDIPYSNRLKAQVKVVAKLHTKVDNIRDVSIIAFGVASLTLGAGSHSPEAGQVFVRRGEGKALCGESRLCESECREASESSGKLQPSQALRRSTTGAEATVGGKTRSSRIADRYGIAT
jgi:hypothetical protein